MNDHRQYDSSPITRNQYEPSVVHVYRIGRGVRRLFRHRLRGTDSTAGL
jgi:hypothetical protein